MDVLWSVTSSSGLLSELVHGARGGLGGLMLVEGPPGVGKSALLERGGGDGTRGGLARAAGAGA